MNKDEIHNSLEDLRDVINRLDHDDRSAREELNRRILDIEELLEAPDFDEGKLALIDKLETDTQKFEIEHPRITSILNRIAITLSNMGI